MEINGSLIKYEDGKIWKFGKCRGKAKEETWFELKGSIATNPNGYKRHVTAFNHGVYTTARLIYKLHNPEWDINDSSSINTIDHININSLDNRIENLRVATMSQQNVNQTRRLTAKGYCRHKGKWCATIRINCKVKYLGYFEKEEDARNAYLNAVNERIKI
jgi:hypothetical protein